MRALMQGHRPCRGRALPSSWRWPIRRQEPRAAAAAAAIRAPGGRDPGGQCRGHARGAAARPGRCAARSARLWTPQRVEAMARGLEEVAALPDPIGTVIAAVDAAERACDPARARAARGHRHHLREPAQRDRRCRRAVPEVRQCGDPARRLGERPLERGDPCLPGGGAAGGGPAAPRRSSWCPPPIVPRSARCSAACRSTSTCWCRAAARAWWHACSARRAYRSSATWKATATSTWIATPIWPWRAASRSTPRCAAPAFAAPPRRCWWIAAVPPGIWRPLIGDLIDAGCEVRGDEGARAADARVRPATEADWYTEYLDAIIAVRVVDGVDEAIAHIARYGSAHTEAIVTGNAATARALPGARRQRHRAAQRLDAIRRRRRVRHGRGDRHLDRSLPRARSGRRRAAHQLQVRGARLAGRCAPNRARPSVGRSPRPGAAHVRARQRRGCDGRRPRSARS